MDKKPLRIYKTSVLMRVTTLVFILALAAFGIFVLTSPMGREAAEEEWDILWPLWIAAIPFLAWVLLQYGMEELRIHQDGIEHRRGNTSSFANWENLLHFGQENGNPCIVTNIETNSKRDFFIHLPLECGVPLDVKQKGLHIDIGKFHQKPLGQDIYRFAPHLFRELKT